MTPLEWLNVMKEWDEGVSYRREGTPLLLRRRAKVETDASRAVHARSKA
jgi:hypothetical protein